MTYKAFDMLGRLARMKTGDEMEGGMSGDDAASTLSALIEESRRILSPPEDGPPPVNEAEDAIIMAMVQAHDQEEAAQRGEPSPWREDLGAVDDHDWVQGRFLAMREAFDVLKAAHGRRVDDLLEANNRYLGRARDAEAALALTGWRPMKDAPKDGREIETLCVHRNAVLSADAWGEGLVSIERPHWIDHNGGGWTWNGLCGVHVAWRPASSSDGLRPLDRAVANIVHRLTMYDKQVWLDVPDVRTVLAALAGDRAVKEAA